MGGATPAAASRPADLAGPLRTVPEEPEADGRLRVEVTFQDARHAERAAPVRHSLDPVRRSSMEEPRLPSI
ncbi:hypothetical protein [Streptomyces lateritius]|uniref:hypothetical protein n=1 Tax=Streptomyces lateritius TaxID=67313 RepID=UPI001C8C8E1C|nr:hypothetical protein [Streptomyces lateritius]MBX9421798.1 hypothetical protein [Streptomyces lateritius]